MSGEQIEAVQIQRKTFCPVCKSTSIKHDGNKRDRKFATTLVRSGFACPGYRICMNQDCNHRFRVLVEVID